MSISIDRVRHDHVRHNSRNSASEIRLAGFDPTQAQNTVHHLSRKASSDSVKTMMPAPKSKLTRSLAKAKLSLVTASASSIDVLDRVAKKLAAIDLSSRPATRSVAAPHRDIPDDAGALSSVEVLQVDDEDDDFIPIPCTPRLVDDMELDMDLDLSPSSHPSLLCDGLDLPGTQFTNKFFEYADSREDSYSYIRGPTGGELALHTARNAAWVADRFTVRIEPFQKHTELWNANPDSTYLWMGALYVKDTALEPGLMCSPLGDAPIRSFKLQFRMQGDSDPLPPAPPKPTNDFQVWYNGLRGDQARAYERCSLVTGICVEPRWVWRINTSDWAVIFYVPVPVQVVKMHGYSQFRVDAQLELGFDECDPLSAVYEPLEVTAESLMVGIEYLTKEKDMDGTAPLEAREIDHTRRRTMLARPAKKHEVYYDSNETFV